PRRTCFDARYATPLGGHSTPSLWTVILRRTIRWLFWRMELRVRVQFAGMARTIASFWARSNRFVALLRSRSSPTAKARIELWKSRFAARRRIARRTKWRARLQIRRWLKRRSLAAIRTGAESWRLRAARAFASIPSASKSEWREF